MATEKAQQSKLVSMDISAASAGTLGGLGSPQPDDFGDQSGFGDQGVDAISQGARCWTCQGVGHLARNCPLKGKGKGKGDFGKGGKGGPKGDEKGQSFKGWPGDGKGFGWPASGKGFSGAGLKGGGKI